MIRFFIVRFMSLIICGNLGTALWMCSFTFIVGLLIGFGSGLHF